MQWQNRRQSTNIEDQRGMGNVLPIGGGIGTIVIALIVYFMGGNPMVVLNQSPSTSSSGRTTTSISPSGGSHSGGSAGKNDTEKQFIAVVLADTEDMWGKYFEHQGKHYRDPKLVLFTGRVNSACGVAGASSGPFYCPEDQKLYLDTSFFQEMKSRYGAPGDFAEAYVIAHEVGHHVQKMMGTSDKIEALEQQVGEKERNQLSVRLELQADFYAGVWAHYAQKKGMLDPGDIEEALNAASAVGDDRLEQESQGYVVPDSFTHGTSAQRVEWFKKGYESGEVRQGNTLTASLQ